jgi:dTDP-4-dehydrorhamnose reductase
VRDVARLTNSGRTRVAVTGADGQLGRQLVAILRTSGYDVLPLVHGVFDLANPASFQQVIEWRPTVVINAAAWTDVDGCARDPDRAAALNGEAPGRLAAVLPDALFVQISTNEVFSGDSETPYREVDEPRPVNAYGMSKLLGERSVQSEGRRVMIVRTAWLFGPGGKNFVTKILSAADDSQARGTALRVVEDEWANPTWTPALAHGIISLLQGAQDLPSIVHIAGTPACSRLTWAVETLMCAGISGPIIPIRQADFVRASIPPLRAILSTELADSLGILGLEWKDPLADYVKAL